MHVQRISPLRHLPYEKGPDLQHPANVAQIERFSFERKCRGAGNDPEIEYLSDGITEGLINSLSELPGLRVIARPTAFTFKGKSLNLGNISRMLKVRTLLVGQVAQRRCTQRVSRSGQPKRRLGIMGTAICPRHG